MKEDYKDFLGKASDGSTNIDLKSEQVERGERLTLQWIASEDEDTAFTYLRYGIEKGGVIHWFAEEKSPSAGELYWTENPLHLVEGERLVARFNGTTSADMLRTTLLGYIDRIPGPGKR